MYGNLRVLAEEEEEEEEEEEASGAGERTYCLYVLWQGYDSDTLYHQLSDSLLAFRLNISPAKGVATTVCFIHQRQ
jgi:hypothetical protein